MHTATCACTSQLARAHLLSVRLRLRLLQLHQYRPRPDLLRLKFGLLASGLEVQDEFLLPKG
jgi:hypothetical protein